MNNYTNNKFVCLDKEIINDFLKEFHGLIEKFMINAKSSPNTDLFLKIIGQNEKEKFLVETIILYFSKAIFMKYCIDNNYLAFDLKNNLYESLNEFYDDFGEKYFRLSSDEYNTYYIPPPHLDSLLLHALNRYDFRGVDTDVIGKLYEKFLLKEERILLGQVYTPDEVIDYILKRVGYTSDDCLEDKMIIDISCGSGAFIIKAAITLIQNLKKKNYNCEFILKTLQDNIFGLDINPFSLQLAELNLILVSFDLLREAKNNNPSFEISGFNLYQTNTIKKDMFDNSETLFNLKNRTGYFKKGFDFIVGNPPYLEAKKMPETIKLACRKNFPEIASGAFDLYFCFIKMALELLGDNGILGYIIPNKFQVLKSAKRLRKHIIDKFCIEEIVDISNLNIFKDISVYPILFFVKSGKRDCNQIKTYDSVCSLEYIGKGKNLPVEISQKDFLRTEDFIFFTLPNDDIGLRIYEKMRSCKQLLKEYLNIKWTISFHKKGIIDYFIFRTPEGINAKPILGADINSRDSEVFQFKIKWNGYWIDYDREKAKKIGNPFPPSRVFETPKIIIRQNADRLTAAIDREGRWYLKDVFLSGMLTEKSKEENISLEYIGSLLNSKLMNYYYSILYKGGHVNGGYLHFLVGYLNSLPIILIPKDLQIELENLVKSLEKNNNYKIKNTIDIKICEIFSLSELETQFILER